MTGVGFVIHGGREKAVRAAADLVGWLGEREVETWATDERLEPDHVVDAKGFPPGLDLVVAVGGDGTLLRAAEVAARCRAPVLGVQVGRMGFLTEVDPEDAPALLERAIAGTARIEERMAVVAEPEGAEWTEPQWGLNEVIVEKSARHRLLRLAMYLAGERVTALSGDGVIVATPTGSTAYSFSAGGPIVAPALRSLVVTPVAPHMVFDRAFVLAPDETVTLEVLGDEPGLISADGRDSLELPVGARIVVRAAGEPARLVRADSESFYARVRDKFSLPGGSGG